MTPLEWGIVAAIVALGGTLLWHMASAALIIAVPSSLTIEQNKTAPLAAVLLYKKWFRTKLWRVQGNVTVISGSIVQVTPGQAGTSHAAAAAFTVTGMTVGQGIIKVNGRSRHATHDTIDVPVTVTAPPE